MSPCLSLLLLELYWEDDPAGRWDKSVLPVSPEPAEFDDVTRYVTALYYFNITARYWSSINIEERNSRRWQKQAGIDRARLKILIKINADWFSLLLAGSGHINSSEGMTVWQSAIPERQISGQIRGTNFNLKVHFVGDF